MSVWKRLGNVAKGSVKTWTRSGDSARDAAMDEIEAELEQARGTVGRSEDRVPVRRTQSEAPTATGAVRTPEREPVPRTDLFADTPTDAQPHKADLFADEAPLPDADPTELTPEPPLAEEAARVEQAVADVVDDAFAGFDDASAWDRLEEADVEEAVEVTDTVKRRL